MQQTKDEQSDFKSIYEQLKNIISEVNSSVDINEEDPQTESQLDYNNIEIETSLDKQIIQNTSAKNLQFIFNEILQISLQQFLVVHAFQCSFHQFYIYQTIYDGNQLNHIQTLHLILEQNETDTVQEPIKVTVLTPFYIDSIGYLLGTNLGQIIRFYKHTNKIQCLAGTSIIDIRKMNQDFQGTIIKHLCVVGFNDHQINIFDYNSFFNVWVFKEGFNIPVNNKFLRTLITNSFIISAGEDGTVTFWQITHQIIQHLKIGQVENYVNHKAYPKFEVVPLTKICEVHRTPLKFIELFGYLIVSIEEDGTFRIWYMEHNMKQFLTIWKFKIEENIQKFGLNEQLQQLYMSNEEKIFIMAIPSNEDEDFQLKVFENKNKAKEILIDFNSNILSWIEIKQQDYINSGVSVFKIDQYKQLEVELTQQINC